MKETVGLLPLVEAEFLADLFVLLSLLDSREDAVRREVVLLQSRCASRESLSFVSKLVVFAPFEGSEIVEGTLTLRVLVLPFPVDSDASSDREEPASEVAAVELIGKNPNETLPHLLSQVFRIRFSVGDSPHESQHVGGIPSVNLVENTGLGIQPSQVFVAVIGKSAHTSEYHEEARVGQEAASRECSYTARSLSRTDQEACFENTAFPTYPGERTVFEDLLEKIADSRNLREPR